MAVNQKKANCKCNCNDVPTKTKDIVLVKELNRVLYALAVRTTANMVYTDNTYTVTLTELISDISATLVSDSKKITIISEKLNHLLKDAPEEADTLKKLFDYLTEQNESNKQALIELIETKVDKEEGKGLSTHDLTDLLYEKLVNDYTKEELDEKFTIIAEKFDEIDGTPNIYVIKNDDNLDNVKDGNIFYEVVNHD